MTRLLQGAERSTKGTECCRARSTHATLTCQPCWLLIPVLPGILFFALFSEVQPDWSVVPEPQRVFSSVLLPALLLVLSTAQLLLPSP